MSVFTAEFGNELLRRSVPRRNLQQEIGQSEAKLRRDRRAGFRVGLGDVIDQRIAQRHVRRRGELGKGELYLCTHRLRGEITRFRVFSQLQQLVGNCPRENGPL